MNHPALWLISGIVVKSRSTPLVCAVLVTLFVTPAANGFAQLDTRRQDGRDGERRTRPDAVPGAPAVVVDGTPRPFPQTLPRDKSVAVPVAGRVDGRQEERHRSSASLSTVTDESGMEVPLGGDDVIVATSPYIEGQFLQVTNDGRIFVAVALLAQVNIYRSTDGGDSWSLWSTFTDGAASSFVIHDFVVSQGNANRAFIGYGISLSGDSQVRVAYANIDAGPPAWTIVTVMAHSGIDHGIQLDIDTDAAVYSPYYVYVAARSADGNGDDIWFTRSTNQGTSYEAAYKVVNNTAGASTWLGNPLVSYGSGNLVHLSYNFGAGGGDWALWQRRATGAASSGLASWESPVLLDPTGNGLTFWNAALCASLSDGNVFLVLWDPVGPGIVLRYSTNWGAAWPSGNQGPIPVGREDRQPLVLFPTGEMAVVGPTAVASTTPIEVQVTRSNTSNPLAWSTPESVTRHDWWTYDGASVAPDVTRGNRLAVMWGYRDDVPRDVVRFDAEWRRDPGYPNTDVGFPIAVMGGGQTPPAVAEVDGDPELEIVFGTISGNIHVVNHDGTPVSGWPVNINSMPFDAPVAVGDLAGYGVPSIVAGNTSGQVFAFRPDGSLEPGWPVTMNEVANVYVSIGALGPPRPRYVVALCGHEMRAIRYDGVDVSPLWGTFGDFLTRPAAIGDVDDDGVAEIVTLKGSLLHIHNLNDFSSEVFRNFPGEVFSDAPTLADFDLDGTLEIAAPTMSGKMYLINHDGTDFSASWPITVSPGVRLTAAALADILGGAEVEMAFSEANGAVHVRWYDGVEQSSYPKASGSSNLYMPPMLSPVNILVSNVNIGTTDGVNGDGQSWRNLGMVPEGWPKNLPGPVEETFASGDIDNDGRNELVVLGVEFLTVLDVGVAPAGAARDHWPMYGYDAQRTGCLACEEILTAVDDPPKAAFRTAIEVRPNPFNPATTIEYEVEGAGKVSLDIFDVAGRLVETLINGEYRDAGRYAISYTGTVVSGVYFARLRTAGGEVTSRIVVLK